MGEDIKITTLTKKELHDVILKNTYWDNDAVYIPFSKSKAKWILKNARIDPDDICAVLGTQNKTVISFVFLVPDLFKTKTGTEKIFWSRRWWISEKYRGSVLPTYNMNLAIQSVNNKVVVKFLCKDIEEYYRKQPFAEFALRTRYYVIFNLDSNIVLSKFNSLKNIKGIVTILDSLSLSFVSFLNNLKVKKKTKSLVYDYVSSIDELLWQFIMPFCEKDLILKTREYINWQIDNSQYTNAPIMNKFPKKCLVSSIGHRMCNISYIVKKEHTIIGFISFLIRGNEAVVRYFICEDKHLEFCANALIENVIKIRVTNIQTENEKLGKYIEKRFTHLYTNKRKLYSLAHNDVNIDLDNATVNDRDGNFA